jgi:hypothetical protein
MTVVIDQDASVPTNSPQSFPFTIKEAGNVMLQVTGSQNTAKGYTVMVIDSKSAQLLAAGKKSIGLPEFYSASDLSVKKTYTLQPGDYVLKIVNSKNLMKTMVVHIKLTLNPRSDQ